MRQIAMAYEGLQQNLVRSAAQTGAHHAAYYYLTQHSQAVANSSKQLLFVSPHKTFNAVTKPGTGVCGMRSDRTHAWESAMSSVLPWWQSTIEKLEEACTCLIKENRELTECLGESKGLIDRNWQYSTIATKVGTGLHEQFGEEIMRRTAKSMGFKNHEHLSHVIPGRTAHAGLPLHGATTDCMSMLVPELYPKFLEAVHAGKVTEANILAPLAAPRLTCELKTLHRPDATVEHAEIDDLWERVNDCDLKDHVLRLLERKLVAGGCCPQAIFDTDTDKGGRSRDVLNHAKAAKGGSVPSKNPLPYAFQRGTSIMRTADYEEIGYNSVSGVIYPNLISPPISCVKRISNPKWHPPMYYTTGSEEHSHAIDFANRVLVASYDAGLEGQRLVFQSNYWVDLDGDHVYGYDAEVKEWKLCEQALSHRLIANIPLRERCYTEDQSEVEWVDSGKRTKCPHKVHKPTGKFKDQTLSVYRMCRAPIVCEKPREKEVNVGQVADSEVVDRRIFVNPGKACCHVYAVGEDRMNAYLFTVEWDKAPLMLGINSDFFNQVMSQHTIARQLNDGVRSLFAIMLRSKRDVNTRFGRDPIQIAMVYVYDVGVTDECVRRYEQRLIEECGYASPSLRDELDALNCWPPQVMDQDAVNAMLFRARDEGRSFYEITQKDIELLTEFKGDRGPAYHLQMTYPTTYEDEDVEYIDDPTTDEDEDADDSTTDFYHGEKDGDTYDSDFYHREEDGPTTEFYHGEEDICCSPLAKKKRLIGVNDGACACNVDALALIDTGKEQFKKPYLPSIMPVEDFECPHLSNRPYVAHIAEDGNCGFRCVSLHFFDSEDYHEPIRQFILKFICDHADVFKTYIDPQTTVSEYISQKRMVSGDPSSWVSEVELYAIATAFQIHVYVHTQYGSTRRWVAYKPLFKSLENSIDSETETVHYMSLVHYQNHYRLLLSDTHASRHCHLSAPV